MKYCPNCGAKLNDGADVCIKCGKLLNVISNSEIATKNSKYANFGQRLAACLIDGITTGIVGFIIGFVFGAIMSLAGYDVQYIAILSYLLGLVLGWLYYALMESSKLQGTLGKMALGIKVTDLNGKRISFGKATGRYFGKIISVITFYMGFLMVAFTDKRQGLHDAMAGTLVLNK